MAITVQEINAATFEKSKKGYSAEQVDAYAVYPMTWAVTAFCQYFYYRTGQWVPEDMRNQMKKVQPDLL